MLKIQKVLLSMSGGIDSSVAAMMLLKQDYQIVGVTYRTWDSVSQGCFEKEKGCCSINAIMEAKRLAEQLGFEHFFLDLREQFKNSVIKNFTDEYLAGRTPNPCIVCNASIKWGEVLNLADSLGCDYIATGHYAQIVEKQGNLYLKKGVDTQKDQTYFLWRLPQEVLGRTIFPLGTLTKPEVRQIARENGYEKLAQKAESQEICFIPDNNYRIFLKNEVPDYEQICTEGNFVDIDGKILGKHSGYPNFTVGQRKGLNIALGKPAFVREIRPQTNEVVLADRNELETQTLTAKNCIFVNRSELPDNLEVEARIRYKSPATKARIVLENNGRVKVHFASTVWAVAPGQSVVFYRDDLIIGGGIICS